jgi:hypothetical protein
VVKNTASNDPWVLQVPYRMTKSGSVLGKGADTKLYKMSTINPPAVLKHDFEIIRRLFSLQKDGLELDTGDFTESKVYRR